MLSTESPELHQMCLKIEQDDKFFSRLISKESSIKKSSFNYGSGVSGAVPFLWESQPGIPKHAFSEDTLPPLTPPPSYSYNSNKKPTNKINSKSNLLHTLFRKITLKKKTEFSSSLSSTSLWSSSDLSSTDHFSSPSSSFEYSSNKQDIDYELGGVNNVAASPTSTFCFGFGW